MGHTENKMRKGAASVPDYKSLYYQLFRRTEQARRLLEIAQQEAEAAFLAEEEPPLYLQKNDTDDTQ